MAESKKEVKVFQTKYICDDCGMGEMIAQPPSLVTPVYYKYICNNESCKKEEVINKTYPRIVYEEIP